MKSRIKKYNEKMLKVNYINTNYHQYLIKRISSMNSYALYRDKSFSNI